MECNNKKNTQTDTRTNSAYIFGQEEQSKSFMDHCRIEKEQDRSLCILE